MKKRIFFICGSLNQTTQMHQVAEHLREYELAFSPYYCHGLDEMLRRLGLMEFTIIGHKLAGRCRTYLQDHGLPIDYRGTAGPYDLVVTCSDVYLQRNIRESRIVLVQEGVTDPESFAFQLVKRLRFLPRWLAGTAATGLSHAYGAFCVASEGYRDFFIRKGACPEKIVVTGIPNFDNCQRYRRNDFPHRHYVLVCTSPLREVFRGEDRKAFIRRAVAIAGGRPLIFKLHPNENSERATGEIHRYAPGAVVFTTGSAEEMIANCDVLITRFSSTAFVGLALGKETHSDFDLDEMRRLLPVQNGSAALNIANVCRRFLEADSEAGPLPPKLCHRRRRAAAEPNARGTGGAAAMIRPSCLWLRTAYSIAVAPHQSRRCPTGWQEAAGHMDFRDGMTCARGIIRGAPGLLSATRATPPFLRGTH
jgi:hypothetical protein